MKTKRLMAMGLAAVMTAGMAGCGSSSSTSSTASSSAGDVVSTTDSAAASTADSTAAASSTSSVATETVGNGSKGTIKVWVADAAVDFTTQEIQQFVKDNSAAADYTFSVEPVGEADAATNMITDVNSGADVYGFAQDQLARLVSAGALETVADENIDTVKSDNDSGAVSAATVGDTLYAYPLTSDNGYFLYYDKSVVTDPSDLDKILSDCAAAKKNFYMEINNGWYQTAFFFGTGCKLTYDTDKDGNFTKCDVDYASDAGVEALKEIIKVQSSSAFQNGSSAGDATNVGAIVDGTWDAATVKKLFGDNYACAKLPSWTGTDGKTYQMSGFSGYKLLGVKPQEDDDKLAVCDDLAKYLSSEEVQLARYQAIGWGPSNLKDQQSSDVQSDEALKALNEQMQYDIPQGNYPNDYWDLAKSLGDDIIQGKITSSTSDSDLKSTLQKFQDTCQSYAQG